MKPFILLLTAILLAACGLAPASVPTATKTAPLTSEVAETSEVLPASTPRPTQTLEATVTAEAFGLPPALVTSLPEDLPKNWTATQDEETKTWYIDNAKTQEAVLRSSPDGKKWQVRRDVTTDNGIFEGWITAQGHADVLEGRDARMDTIIIGLGTEGLDYNQLEIPFGYMTDYTVVEISDGNETMDVVFFETIYFYSNGTELRIKFMADKKLVERNGIEIHEYLGKLISVPVLTPRRDDFSQDFITTVSSGNQMSNIQVKVDLLGSKSWIKAYELLAKLQNFPTGILNLELKVLVDHISEY